MEVKIYREPENEQLILDENQLNEHNQLLREMGLHCPEGSGEYIPVVYPFLNSGMVKMLGALCPQKVGVKQYTVSTIPIEVLRVLRFAQENGMFDSYEIWYADKDPDPLLIGKRYPTQEDRENGYSWKMNTYLIARWGDCAMELKDLLKKGYDSIRLSVLESAKIGAEKANSIVASPDTYVNMYLKGQDIDIKIDVSGSLIF